MIRTVLTRLAAVLGLDRGRDLVATLCPDDAEWQAFLLDPEGAFLPADPWIEDAA